MGAKLSNLNLNIDNNVAKNCSLKDPAEKKKAAFFLFDYRFRLAEEVSVVFGN
jgi:hypothetical protein